MMRRYVSGVCYALILLLPDLAGRRVNVLADRAYTKGPCQLSWDGRDDYGAALPSGVYLVRVNAESFTSSRSINLVR